MKLLYLCIGFISLGFGCLGVILPILPTTPFLLLASFCFAKGSVHFHTWFVQSRLYQKYLADFVCHRTMTLRNKVILLSLASTMLLISFIVCKVMIARLIIGLLFVFKYYYFFFCIKTKKVEDDEDDDK